ncbi:MAG TPA: hypothetical protein VGK74_26615 [Symbiobacteriaceae bacterium]|jgi:Rieske Fe-S protein
MVFRWILAALLVGLACIIGISVLAVPLGPAQIAIDTSGLPDVSAHPIPPGIALRATIQWQKPTMVLLARDGDTWRAFSNRSTHLGEPVIWRADDNRFYDTVSSAMWDKAGRPVAGPAPRGLDWYPVTVAGDYVIVDLSQPKPGGRY